MAYPNQYLIGRDPFEEQRRQMMAQYSGQVPPVGIAGSLPQQTVAPMPPAPQMPPQPQPQMGMAGAQGPQGIGLSQQPVVPPAPMPQPQGVGVANNLDAGQPPGMQEIMQEPTVGEMGIKSAVDQPDVSVGGESGGFNSKALGKALSSAAKTAAASQQTIKSPGLLQQARAPQQVGMAGAMMQPQQPGMSGAMQAISGNIGQQPQLLEMLKRMRR